MEILFFTIILCVDDNKIELNKLESRDSEKSMMSSETTEQNTDTTELILLNNPSCWLSICDIEPRLIFTDTQRENIESVPICEHKSNVKMSTNCLIVIRFVVYFYFYLFPIPYISLDTKTIISRLAWTVMNEKYAQNLDDLLTLSCLCYDSLNC